MTREHLKLEVVRFYYFENLNQNEIARKIGISRSYVSKLLIEARKEKLIEFKSRNPWLTETEEERSEEKEHKKNCRPYGLLIIIHQNQYTEGFPVNTILPESWDGADTM